ncbi:type II secretion system F family protein [Eggerthellaceae bacterium zg-887]|uniref:type II secretion system F family protein n=1 Tax=Xiamenia xianingshaonis TaxID=2682776 RepID=UPI001409BF72|nr:type II secretion system F family protein [Xiamenia xianingshaonis]NHM16321.1 type II secretion system F family protein [Xiamenia xianingshaonis]
MAKSLLESSALSAFCESMALMFSAGIQTDEAVHMLSENMKDSSFKRACNSMYGQLINGSTLADAMEGSKAFPVYAIDMVRLGERTGRLEHALRSLSVYYDEEDRLFSKIRSSIGYPAALLCVMSVILAFTVAVILPVFVDVYESLSGSLTSGSFSSVNVSIGIGWVALGVTLVCTILALFGLFMSRSEKGRQRMLRLFEKTPFTRQAMYQMALSRFSSTLAIYIASGENTDDAMRDALGMINHRGLKKKVQAAYDDMIDVANAKGLAQVISEHEIFEPVYARMLAIGNRSGGLDGVLDHLSAAFFDDAVQQLDRIIDTTEPALAAFMTIAVGATLVSVMLPLIGIMGSIG